RPLPGAVCGHRRKRLALRSGEHELAVARPTRREPVPPQSCEVLGRERNVALSCPRLGREPGVLTASVADTVEACTHVHDAGVEMAAIASTSRCTSPPVSVAIGTAPTSGSTRQRSASSYLRSTLGL